MLNRKTLLALIYGLCLCAGPAAATETDHQRVIALKGTQNTRDIGGYQTDDGREVRWGKILRSDNLSRLRPEDFQQLEDMGLKTVIDLRTPKEVKNAPTNWQGESAADLRFSDWERRWCVAQGPGTIVTQKAL